ncbi:hypothetical protein [Rhizohabitans arisaemae]|uniref:hypothetical protein n=1 Tax=Rhizohabitans arisaemae TaxID=2720610 RepID=UPI0024B0CD0F|nr:hypothetical protein [Rhizohabitans arisaemae]
MNNILSKVGTLAAGLTLVAALVPPAQAAQRPAAGGFLYELVFGSLQAFDLEESGEDEIRVELIAQNGTRYSGWPTNGSDADTKAGTCWVWDFSACTGNYTKRVAGAHNNVIFVSAGQTFTIEVWEDDHIGDDLLLRIPVTATGSHQNITGTTPAGKGFSYQFKGYLRAT